MRRAKGDSAVPAACRPSEEELDAGGEPDKEVCQRKASIEEISRKYEGRYLPGHLEALREEWPECRLSMAS